MIMLKLSVVALFAGLAACANFEPLPASDISESRDAELHRHAQYGDR